MGGYGTVEGGSGGGGTPDPARRVSHDSHMISTKGYGFYTSVFLTVFSLKIVSTDAKVVGDTSTTIEAVLSTRRGCGRREGGGEGGREGGRVRE